MDGVGLTQPAIAHAAVYISVRQRKGSWTPRVCETVGGGMGVEGSVNSAANAGTRLIERRDRMGTARVVMGRGLPWLM